MTTVDLTEQLLAIGRQLQATERRLTQTPSRLELPPVLQQMLADPMARLSDLLQPFTNWSVPQSTSDSSAPASAPYRWSQRVSWPPGNFQGGGPWPAADTSASWDQAQGSAAPSEVIRPISSTPEPMDQLSSRTGAAGKPQTVSAGQRVRLIREPSGLLSILQSNVVQPVEPTAVTAPGVARATGRGSPPASGPGHPSNAWSIAAHGVPPGVPNLAEHRLYVAVENASMAANAPDDAATALPAMARAPLQEQTPATLNRDNHLVLPHADIGTEGNVQAVYPLPPGEDEGEGGRGRARVNGALPLTPTLSQWERGTGQVVGPFAPLMMEPTPQVDGSFPPERMDLSYGLTAEQLEQIIDALAERLELMLIRAYGTTGA